MTIREQGRNESLCQSGLECQKALGNVKNIKSENKVPPIVFVQSVIVTETKVKLAKDEKTKGLSMVSDVGDLLPYDHGGDITDDTDLHRYTMKYQEQVSNLHGGAGRCEVCKIKDFRTDEAEMEHRKQRCT